MLKPCEIWGERLSAYLDGEVNNQERAAVEAHLRGCAACRAHAELLRCDAQDAGAALLARGAGVDFAARVLAQVSATTIENPATLETPLAQKSPAALTREMPESRRKRFSWVELLVVCGTTALLAAILFPVFGRGREKARQTTCSSNQRQLVASILMYAQDHGEKLPDAATWVQDIHLDPGVLIDPTAGKTLPVAYAYNLAISGKAVGEISDTTTTVATFDARDGQIDYRHSNQAIASYLDGHVGQIANPESATGGVERYVPATVPKPPMPPMVPDMPSSGKAVPTRHAIEARQRITNGNAVTSAKLMDMNGAKATVDAAPAPPQAASPATGMPASSAAKKPRLMQPTIAPPVHNYGLADKLQIAYKAALSMESDDVLGAMEQTELLFHRYDGFVLNSTYNKGGGGVLAGATVSGRAPAEKIGVLLAELDKQGTVTARQVNGEDLTADHLKNIATLGNLAGAQGNLENIERRSRSTQGRLTTEGLRGDKAATATNTRVEDYKLNSRVALAEVTVTIAARPAPAPVRSPLQDSLNNSYKALTGLWTWLLSAILIPAGIFLPVWGPLLGIVIYWRRRMLRGGGR